MSLEFYDNTNKLLYGDFKGYMREGACWNDASVIGTAVSTYATQRNSVDGITGILTSGASRFGMDKIVYDNTTTMQRLTMAQAISASSERVVVLKGIHQASNPHITVACGQKIYHLYVSPLGSDQTNFSVKSMSAGEDYDQLGWQTM